MSEMFESAAAAAALKGRTLIFSEDNCKLLPLFTVTDRKEKKVGKQPSQLLISLSFILKFCVFRVCAISISEVDTNEEKVWLNTSYHCKHGSSSSSSEAVVLLSLIKKKKFINLIKSCHISTTSQKTSSSSSSSPSSSSSAMANLNLHPLIRTSSIRYFEIWTCSQGNSSPPRPLSKPVPPPPRRQLRRQLLQDHPIRSPNDCPPPW